MVQRAKKESESRCRRKAHILVVDDDMPILKMAECILTDEGYRVTTCSSGAGAVEVYSKLHDEIDLVILDMVMPEMSGIETLRHLKLIDPTVRAILCSAFIPDLDGQAIAAEGFVSFIAKPFNTDDLLALAELHTR